MKLSIISLGIVAAIAATGALLHLGIQALAAVWYPSQFICYGILAVITFFVVRDFLSYITCSCDCKNPSIHHYVYHASDPVQAETIESFIAKCLFFKDMLAGDVSAARAYLKGVQDYVYPDPMSLTPCQRFMLQELLHIEKLIGGLIAEIEADSEFSASKNDQLISMMMYCYDLDYRCCEEGVITLND